MVGQIVTGKAVTKSLEESLQDEVGPERVKGNETPFVENY